MLEELQKIQRQRKTARVLGLLFSVGVAELLFAFFALGAARGPAPLHRIELLVAGGVALFVGAILARSAMRRRLESGATFARELDEGTRSCRLVIFPEYFTLGAEVVLKEALESVEIKDGTLVIRYRDARLEGHVLRELKGDPAHLLGCAEHFRATRQGERR